MVPRAFFFDWIGLLGLIHGNRALPVSLLLELNQNLQRERFSLNRKGGKAMLYRLFAECKNEAELEKLITNYFEGFTLVKGEGFWRLQKENSLIIEIVTEDTEAKINGLAEDIKRLNNQESVLVQRINNKQWFV